MSEFEHDTEDHDRADDTDQTETEGEPVNEDRIATLTRQAEELYDHTWKRLQELRAERHERESAEADEVQADEADVAESIAN